MRYTADHHWDVVADTPFELAYHPVGVGDRAAFGRFPDDSLPVFTQVAKALASRRCR